MLFVDRLLITIKMRFLCWISDNILQISCIIPKLRTLNNYIDTGQFAMMCFEDGTRF